MKPLYKVARTEIYKALFGMQEHTLLNRTELGRLGCPKRSNVPENDPTRRLSTFWEYNEAKRVFEAYIGDCKFSPERVEYLRERLEQLRQFVKRKQPAE